MKIYLAGLEQKDAIEVVRRGLIRHGFLSYYYLRSKGEAMLLEARKHIQSVIIDSGAHTFFSELSQLGLSVSVHTKKTKTKEDPQTYFSNFVAWLEKNYNLYDYFVELDIGEIVGQAQVLAWREILRQRGIYGKCITVYHPGCVTFNQYLGSLADSQSRFVALEGDRPRRPRLPYGKLIQPAYEKGIRVHGFAFTKMRDLGTYPFYSVDSTSWKAPVQYGAGLGLVANTTGYIDFNGRERHRGNLVGLSKVVDNLEEAFCEDKAKQRQKRFEIAVKAYQRAEDYFTELWAKRGVVWP